MGEQTAKAPGLNRAKTYQLVLFPLNNGATNVYYVLVLSYIATFGSKVLALSMIFASVMVTGMRLFDAITDPIIGALMDRTNGKFGKFRPFMVIGNLIMAASILVLYCLTPLIPAGSMFLRYAAFVALYAVWVIGYTFQTSCTRSGQTVLTNDPKQRPLFTIFNTVGSLLGMGAMQFFAPILAKNYEGGYASAGFFRTLAPVGIVISILLTILAIIYALCIAAAIAFHAREGVQQLMEDPARICIWSLCFLLCLIYHKKRSSYRVAAEHTVLPPLTVILLVTGYFPDVAMFLIIVTIITSIITARSLKIGILRAGTTLAPIPLIKILFANTSHVLSIIISQNSVNAAINPYQFQHWLLPLLIMTVAVPIIRLICDIVTFFFVQIPIRKAMREYSLSHILAMALADLMAIVWIPEILEFANIGSDTATVLSVFMLALIAYSLLLMTVDTMNRLTRSRSALKCIANVSDALPLPNQVPEETVVRRINRGLTRMRCFISNANNLDKRGYSYRYSAPISTGSRQYYLAMERSIWNRPFMSTDETILLTCGEVLTESLRVNKEVTLLRTESETDTLTGALTYRAFIGHLKSLQTENVHNLVAVVYFGVEHLRTVNEHYGRKIGNAVLRSVGMRLSQLLPGNATLSRVNGAEFAMIVTDVTSTSDVEELATRMRNLAVMPVYTEEGEVSVDVSSSISFSNATDGFSVLLADASAHIYESESSNLPVVDGMTSTLAAQNGSGDYFNASDVLRHAIEDNTISVLYQPIFDVNTKRITSLDTIVRVHDAKGRTLAPYFVTAEAHRLNMSVQLTLDVLETCVKDMTAFRKVAPELDIVDICMNGSELGASIFHERLEQLTHEQPQLRFGLQLGSHAIHVVHDEVDDEVAALAALPNVELGLTNAGTTYSEVAAFAHLPLDFARFDKTVVRDFRTPRAKQIMQRTLEISRDNDAFHVVFDGVESLDQVEFIRSIGGTLAEGTLLSNAMSANEFLMRLETMGTSLPEAAPRQAE